MKRIVIFLLVAAIALSAAFWLLRRHRRKAIGQGVELQAMMIDEDAPRTIEPSISLAVNEDSKATVSIGQPLWFTVRVNNAAASNELASAAAIAQRLKLMPANAPARKQLQQDYDRRSAPAAITLGDSAHPWIGAVQLLSGSSPGQAQPLAFEAPLVENPGATATLRADGSTEAIFGVSATKAPVGAYTLIACLGATGNWQGRVCSSPASLTVVAAKAPTTKADVVALEEQRARFAFLAHDPAAMEASGRALVAADRGSPSGHMYLGEASFERNNLQQALNEFLIARAVYQNRNPDQIEQPVFLNARIHQSMDAPNGAKPQGTVHK